MKNVKGLPKIKCEISECNITDPAALHYHHIIEQNEINTDNSIWNLCVKVTTIFFIFLINFYY